MRKRLLITAAIILGVVILGCGWQCIMERIDERNLSAPGSFVDAGAFDMHYVSKGEGEVAVLFITGSGTPCAYTDFYNLQEALSSIAQTISFDHAGTGWSSDANEPRTIENLEKEMTILLNSVAPDKKVVLVCHSLGSLEAIYYAQCHPEKVLGIVFLDSGSPEFYSEDSETAAKLINRGIAFTRVIGLNRLLGNIGVTMPFYGENSRVEHLREDICDIDKVMFYKHAGSSETLKAIREMNENANTVLMGPRLGAIPVLVLSSDSGDEWSDVQDTLAGWSENSRRCTIEGSGHYLHWTNGDEVEEYVVRFVKGLTS